MLLMMLLTRRSERSGSRARGTAWRAADRPERGWRYGADEEALAEEQRSATLVERCASPPRRDSGSKADDR